MNIPILRFPEFNGEWEKKKLGEVAETKVTNSFSRENLNYEIGIVKNIHYGDIHTKFQTLFDLEKEYVPFINSEISIQRISEDNYCVKGDLIFADASEDLNDVGKSIEIVNLNNEKLLSGLHTILVRPKQNTFKKGFAGYLLKSNNIRLQIQKESQGSKILSISGGRLLNTIISFPTLPEQTRIANFLTAVDEKIQTLKKKKSLLENYKKGVMQKLFSVSGRDARSCVFTDEDGQAFPAWEVKKLGEVCEIVGGGTPETNINEYWQGNIQWFTPTEIKSDFVSKSNRTITELGLRKSSAKLLPKGTILLTTRATIGEAAIAMEECTTNQGFQSLIARENVSNVYIFNWIKENKYELTKRANGSTFPEISKSEIEQIEIPIPSLPEQSKIANFLSAIDDKINHNNTQIQKIQVWKKGLLQRMFC